MFKNSASWSSSTVVRLLRLGRLATQPRWAFLMVRRQSHQHATKDSQQERLSFSTKRKVGGCSQSSGLIFTLGQMPCNPKGLERACTVPASLFKEGSGATVITAEDIRQNAGGRQFSYWVTNDSCPPSQGCVLPSKPPNPAASGVSFADVWQFAQSPRRAEFASGCPANYSNDGNCYPPGGEAERLHVDLDVGISTDPSHGRTR